MQPAKTVFKPARKHEWSAERIEALSTDEIEQLRDNAQALGEAAVAALCEEALVRRPRGGGAKRAAPAALKHGRRLISRTKALQARGVHLAEGAKSWSGLRKSDGKVVMCLWAGDVVSEGGACSQLLWAPDADGEHAWSGTPAGRERRAHCELALEQGGAEGLLVYGERLAGRLAEDKARSVHGADPEVVVQFQVERRGEEFWAVWGRTSSKAAKAAAS
jgi:hypothetical protein